MGRLLIPDRGRLNLLYEYLKEEESTSPPTAPSSTPTPVLSKGGVIGIAAHDDGTALRRFRLTVVANERVRNCERCIIVSVRFVGMDGVR